MYTLSTAPEHTTEFTETGKISKNMNIKKKPLSVLDHSNANKGIDFSDQMGAYYSSLRES